MVAAQPGHLLPVLPAVGRAEQGGVFDSGVYRVGIGGRWRELPDPLKLKWKRGAVVPLMSSGFARVSELVADRLPGFAAVIGALDNLPEPGGGLRRVDPVRIGGRPFKMKNFPAREMGSTDVPILARPIRRQDERALARANQQPHLAHVLSFVGFRGS